MEQYVITISRQFGSMGRSIARELSEILGIEFLDRDIVEATAKRMGLPVSVISDEEESMKSTSSGGSIRSEWECPASRMRSFLPRKISSGISQPRDPASLWDAVADIFWRISRII